MDGKTCTKCGQWKDISEFHKQPSKSDGLTCHCKICKREYREANKDRLNFNRRSSYVDNIEHVQKINRKYREKNRDAKRQYDFRYREENKDKISEAKKRCYRRDRDRYIARSISRERGLPPADKETLDHIMWCKRQICSYCWKPGGTHDHVVPVSKGGLNHWSNIIPACQECNDSKGTKSILTWLLVRSNRREVEIGAF